MGVGKRIRVAVIGAGPSGLAAVKELREKGHEVIAFDASEQIGGVFDGTRSYDSLRLTVTNYFMSYSDFMPLDEELRVWTCAEYNAYLNLYVDHFGIRDAIELQTRVDAVRKLESGQWELRVTGPSGEQQTCCVDRVAICAGQFGDPLIPKIPGLDSFTGEIFHSGDYKNPDQFQHLAGKRLLCCGGGESSADVVTELAAIAERTVLSTRSKQHYAPRQASPFKDDPSGYLDVRQTRWWHSIPMDEKTAHIHERFGDVAAGLIPVYGEVEGEAARTLARYNLSSGDPNSSVITKTSRIFDAVVEYGLEMDVGGIERIEGATVYFKSGRREDFDAIMFCTGFSFKPMMLEEKYQFGDIREAYLQMFHPKIGEDLAFIGVVRPHQGGVPLMAELQARYFALLCSGERQLPENLEKLAARDAERWRSEFHESPNVAGLVNALRYNDMLAELIGCRLEEPSAIFDNRRFTKFWFSHPWPIRYRVVGPGAVEGADEIWQKALYPESITMMTRLRRTLRIPFLRLKNHLATAKGNRLREIYDPSYVHHGDKN